MATCSVCGNDYDKAFEVRRDGETWIFDSLACAIHALAPTCDSCGVRIIGHGVEVEGAFYCCANCARHAGVEGVQDRV